MTRKGKIVLCCLLVVAFVFVLCPDASADVFEELKKRSVSFSKHLRILAYAISGFGIIMFTFLAICGKINFKHLGYIFISLFMLSGTGALIDYFSGSHANLKSEFNDTYTKAACNSSICR